MAILLDLTNTRASVLYMYLNDILKPFADSLENEEPVKKIPYKTVFLDKRIWVGIVANFAASFKFAAMDPLLEPQLRNSVSKVCSAA